MSSNHLNIRFVWMSLEATCSCVYVCVRLMFKPNLVVSDKHACLQCDIVIQRRVAKTILKQVPFVSCFRTPPSPPNNRNYGEKFLQNFTLSGMDLKAVQKQGRDEKTIEDYHTSAVYLADVGSSSCFPSTLPCFHTFSGPSLLEVKFYRNFFP